MQPKNSACTPAETAALLQGSHFMYTNANDRLELPSLSMADGPHGLRRQKGGGDNGVSQSEPATAFPTAACIASSWNPENAEKVGRAIGKECCLAGVHMLLGPGVNIKRNPLCGRNFEYYSEDPFLSGTFGAAFIRGVQEMGVAACVKHFAVNNQENYRFVGNSLVDARALQEIYLKPFAIAVREGKPAAVMTAYNRVNGTFCAENSKLITDVLRNTWGFDGIVMSDWGGTNDRIAGIRAGEDLEMPGDSEYHRKCVKEALENGTLSSEAADACVKRIVKTVKKYAHAQITEGVNPSEQNELAAAVAADSAVLLKNTEHILPLSPAEKLCVIGTLFEKMRYQGTGSSLISPTKVITHKDALDARGVSYAYAPGYSDGILPAKEKTMQEAVSLARQHETILLYLGLTDFTESEAVDRAHMRLPKDQLQLVEALASLEKKLIVVLSTGAPVELPFLKDIAALLLLYLPGQCGGEACARLLFGEVTPSGKLPETWYKTYDDVPYGGEYSKQVQELYKESLYVGYRYTETAGVEPRFPFGFGLSYTKFTYSDLQVIIKDRIVHASVYIQNIGDRAGGEVVQLYVQNNENAVVYKARRELRAFAKTYLSPGEKKRITLSFPVYELSFWNVREQTWELENGMYTIQIAASSEDIRLSTPLEIRCGKDTVCPYTAQIQNAMQGAKSIDTETFAMLLEKPIPKEPSHLPLTMESRCLDFRETVVGKFLYSLVYGVIRFRYRKALRMPVGHLRDNHIKNVFFLHKIFDSNCMRTLSLSSGDALPWYLAECLVACGNGHICKGISIWWRGRKNARK